MSFVAVTFCRLNFGVKPFHTKVIENWKDLVIICEKDHANGDGEEVLRFMNHFPRMTLTFLRVKSCLW